MAAVTLFGGSIISPKFEIVYASGIPGVTQPDKAELLLQPARDWWRFRRSLPRCWPRGYRCATRRRAPGRPIVTRSARVGLRLLCRSTQLVQVFLCLI